MARDFDLGIAGPPLSRSMSSIGAGFSELAGGAAQAILLLAYGWWAGLAVGGAWVATHVLLRDSAVWRAGAGEVVARLPSGLDTQLGPTWEDGVELSFGQWQRLALARGLMRDGPLLCVLDEPTAALDAEAEHALFERFAAATRAPGAEGRVTVLVSHRFSTVRMADLIVVLEGARVVEVGGHDELIAAAGLYADLYGIHARAYRR